MTDENKLSLKVGQISIRATDLDRATAFYREVLELKHLHQAPSVSIFDCAGITLLLSLPEASNDGPGSIIFFDVDDIQQAYETLKMRIKGSILQSKQRVYGAT